jgi:hypothetical protein
MDQLLSSTTFNQVYQINSPWFSSDALHLTPTAQIKKPKREKARSEHLAKRRRLSDDHEKPQADQTMDLSVDRDLNDPSYCAKSFLLLSTLASQEQDLLMPMAGIEFPDRIEKVESVSHRKQSSERDDEEVAEIDSGSHTFFNDGRLPDLKNGFRDASSSSTSEPDTPNREGESILPVLPPFSFNDLVSELDERADDATVRQQTSLIYKPDKEIEISYDCEDLGLEDDDAGCI